MDASQLPVIDLSTVYGFEGGFQNSANISTGQDVFINYPNNRSVLSGFFVYENGGAFTANGADVNQITLLANSNTNFRELTPRMLRETMRNIVNSDVPSGSYYLDHRFQPIMTQLYANVQAKFSLGTVNAGISQIISQYEVQYASGAPLPGITVAA
jgi:predicted thioredoxin/glutaredoxin